MAVGRLFSCLIVLAGCASASPVASVPAGQPGAIPVEGLDAAVFEVVVAKYEPAGVEYAEPLPVHLLPKHVRDDAYYSIGTAFTMDGTTFVSAAHVFALQLDSQFGQRSLRGADGTVYAIDQFVRYSGVRDLVVFTLREPPGAAKPLVRGARPAVGATVYTVGNAQGEGLSVRGGNVASFTPEPLDSAWEFIRYSAPTSPGNSGGPLLDGQGRVVGVVVRKNDQENLNYAVPIEELDRLSATRAEFHGRLAEVESGQRHVEDRGFEVELPAGYEALAARARKGHEEAVLAVRAAFEEKFRDTIFPTASALRTYLREQQRYYYLAEMVRDASGRWSPGQATNNSTLEAGTDQSLYIGSTGDYTFAILERPDDVPLATFVTAPERVMEAMLRLLPISRTVAGVQVRVTAIGAPHSRDTWRDALGRPWITVTWRLWDDQVSRLHCTPYPRGLACMLSESSTALAALGLVYARINAPRWTLSYDGRVKDWVEFMALDPALRPSFLSGEVTQTGDKIAVRLGALRLAASGPGLSPDSLLVADVEYASMTPLSMRVAGIGVSTSGEERRGFRVDHVVEPLSESYRDWWNDVVTGKPPYDGKVVRDGGSAEVTLVERTAPLTLGPDPGIEARLVLHCWSQAPDAAAEKPADKAVDKALGKACDAFRASVAVVDAP